MKLKWRVAPMPMGRSRSFDKRGWPTADYPLGQPAVWLRCEQEYRPREVKTKKQFPLRIYVAVWNKPEDRAVRGGFEWVHIPSDGHMTLAHAKVLAEAYIQAHPEIWPAEPENNS